MVSNARAILDSLMRFEIAKKRIENLNIQRLLLTTEKQGLLVENLQLKETNTRQAGQIQVLSEDQRKTKLKLFWANLEKWLWRITAAAVAAYLTHRTLSP